MSRPELEYLDRRERLARRRIGTSLSRTGSAARGAVECTVRRHPLTSTLCAFAVGAASGGAVAATSRTRSRAKDEERDDDSRGFLAGALAMLSTVAGRALLERWIGEEGEPGA